MITNQQDVSSKDHPYIDDEASWTQRGIPSKKGFEVSPNHKANGVTVSPIQTEVNTTQISTKLKHTGLPKLNTY